MKFFFLLTLTLLSQKSFAFLCALDPKLSPDEQQARCLEAGKRYAEWANKEYGLPNTSTTTTTSTKPNLPGLGPDTVWCGTGDRMRENSLKEVVRLSRIEIDMRIQQRNNCDKPGASFKACGYYQQYLAEVIPHSIDAFCKRDSACQAAFFSEKQSYNLYLQKRVPEAIFNISRGLPSAFIDPVLAEDENRAYQEIVKGTPTLEPLARKEFQQRLCRPEKQQELGSDEVECRKFVDLYIESQQRRNIASIPVK